MTVRALSPEHSEADGDLPYHHRGQTGWPVMLCLVSEMAQIRWTLMLCLMSEIALTGWPLMLCLVPGMALIITLEMSCQTVTSQTELAIRSRR